MSSQTLSLYSIEQTLSDLAELRETLEADGDAEAVAVVDQQIAEYLSKEAVKIDSYASLIRRAEMEATACLTESERLHARAATALSFATRLKELARGVMNQFGVRELRTPQNTLRVQGNGGSQPVDIADHAALPASFKRITVTLPLDAWAELIGDLWSDYEVTTKGRIEPDNALIREALKRGEDVPGAKLLERGEHLRVL